MLPPNNKDTGAYKRLLDQAARYIAMGQSNSVGYIESWFTGPPKPKRTTTDIYTLNSRYKEEDRGRKHKKRRSSKVLDRLLNRDAVMKVLRNGNNKSK